MGVSNRVRYILLIPLLFFLVGFITLKDYGISWDEPIHFIRGQAYLNYFLTGELKHNENISERQSYFKNNSLPAYYWLEKDDGHPPLNGILASLSNYIFYEKLNILSDIDAYHLFNLIVSTLAILVVVLFAYDTMGFFGALVAAVAFSTYPLFFAESHFNIKDPAETAFFTATIWSFWKSLEKGNWKWLLLSIIAFSFALGTKFNILFIPFIVIPYTAIRFYPITVFNIPRGYMLTLLLSPFIISIIFFGTWPFLWQDPIGNLIEVFKYYENIGGGRATLGYFLQSGINAYPLVWITITTSPWVLLLFLLGLLKTIKNDNLKFKTGTLWLIWFLVPILRTTLPNTTIYGGVRQIMEYIPAMALISGIGGLALTTLLHKHFRLNRKLAQIAVLSLFIPHLFIMYKMHPNQNVYFNSFIGGLSGAKERNVPYWGNSFGNAYKQAIDWININASEDAKVALVQGTGLNIPHFQLEKSVKFSNYFWSGINREGEYLVELTHNDPVKVYPFAWEYIEKFLEPVYEVKVDGVVIAKVWKNDIENTREKYKREEKQYLGEILIQIEAQSLKIELGENVILTRMYIKYNPLECKDIKGKILTSVNLNEWNEEPDLIPNPGQVSEKVPLEPNILVYYFPGREARGIRFDFENTNSCTLQNPEIRLVVL